MFVCFFRGTSEPYVCNKNNLQSVIPGLFPAERVSTSDAATSSRLQALHNKARVKYSPGYIRRGKRTPYMLMQICDRLMINRPDFPTALQGGHASVMCMISSSCMAVNLSKRGAFSVSIT